MIKRKLSPEEKITAVESYQKGDRHLHTIVEQYGIAKESFRAWVRKYNEKGAEGLVDKHGKRKPESEMTEQEKLRVENRLLEARNKRLELECAVLKNSRKSKGGGAEWCAARASLSVCSGNAQ